MVPPKSKQQSGEEPGFDARLTRLEEIVAALEEGGLDLEPAIERYKEGVELLAGCRELLDGYRRQVEELNLQAEGAVSPYGGDPDVTDDADSSSSDS